MEKVWAGYDGETGFQNPEGGTRKVFPGRNFTNFGEGLFFQFPKTQLSPLLGGERGFSIGPSSLPITGSRRRKLWIGRFNPKKRVGTGSLALETWGKPCPWIGGRAPLRNVGRLLPQFELHKGPKISPQCPFKLAEKTHCKA